MGSQVMHQDTLGTVIAALSQRVSRLETSLSASHSTISAGNLTVLYPDGNQAIVLGLQADGTYGLWQYPDTDGAYPDSPTVKLGELATSLWGLAVLPYGGSELQQVGGALSAFASPEIQSASSTWTNLTGDPVVTADIGPSGEALVTIGCNVATGGTAGTEGSVGIQVDGATNPVSGASKIVVSTAAAGGVNVSTSLTNQLTGLSPGTHTFSLLYITYNITGSTTVGFGARSITVQPL